MARLSWLLCSHITKVNEIIAELSCKYTHDLLNVSAFRNILKCTFVWLKRGTHVFELKASDVEGDCLPDLIFWF